MGDSGGGSGPTVQQQQLETQQALTSANLNLEENSQRKSILNAMMGTRVFKGSALSRALTGNTPGTGGEASAPAPSASQTSENAAPLVGSQASLLDTRTAATGATNAGTGIASQAASAVAASGGYRGGGRG